MTVFGISLEDAHVCSLELSPDRSRCTSVHLLLYNMYTVRNKLRQGVGGEVETWAGGRG